METNWGNKDPRPVFLLLPLFAERCSKSAADCKI